MPRLLLVVSVALLAATSVCLGQNDEKKEGQVSKLVPSSLKKLNNDVSSDLTAQAQSYFIEPELPSSTTVKPTFKRRKTLRPISSLTEKTTKRPSSQDDHENSQPQQNPFSPFRQAVNTGFTKKRPSGQRSRSGAGDANATPDLNSNYPEVNEVRTTTEGHVVQEPSEQTTPREILRRKKVRPAFGSPSPPVVKIDRPNRFAAPRRPGSKNLRTTVPATTTSVTPSTLPESSVFTQDSQVSSQSTLSTPTPSVTRPNFRGGRQGGFVLRPKPTVAATTASTPTLNDENKLNRRRKKPTTEASVSPPEQNENETIKQTSAPVVNVEAPTGRKIPSGLQRRPGVGVRAKLPEIIVSDPPADLLPSNFPSEGRMRGRGASRSPPQLLSDSVHESSDNVATAVLTPDGQAPDAPESNSPAEEKAEGVPSDSASYRPRNLSNRKPNPLDKLTNRQAAARRFLTPKEKKPSEEAATPAPVVHSPVSPLKKTPFSLQNLRNRRLGPGGTTTTTTTTEAPIAEEVPADQQAPGNSTADGDEGKPETGGEEKTEENGDAEAPKEPEEVPPPPPSLPGKRRPPVLPGGRRPLAPRNPPSGKGNGLVKTTTTAAPPQETTTTPTCEDGKRYNKILRKCIPSFAPRSG